LVFSHIDAAGNNGVWSRNLQKRLQAHAKVLEKTYHSLMQKGRIKKMTSVKYPNRKMFIVAGLQPSEDATGGAWFDDGKLDEYLINGVSIWIEKYVSDRSWRVVKQPSDYATHNAHTDIKGKGKSQSAQLDDEQPRSVSPEVGRKEHKPRPKPAPKVFSAHLPGYKSYPTASDITSAVNTSDITNNTRLPLTAVVQLLEVMVYDEKLYKITRPALRRDEAGRDTETDQVVMYRSYKTPEQLNESFAILQKLDSGSASARKAARREVELEDLGRGGASEVPCLRCPAFDLCGDGGPVNVVTCPYFDEWYLRAARADRDEGQAWPDGDDFLKAGERKKQHRLEALTRAAYATKAESNAMDTS
jgi:DNA-directed RNA polymerase III subunit RPC6